MQAFADIQSDLAESGEKTDAQQQIDSEVWQQLLAIQTPMMQGMMSTYIQQSREMFLQMREVMASQTAVLFQNLSGGGTIKPELLKPDANAKKAAKKPKKTES
jgi:polyhydroxyalkanoate synthesis regulator protein